MIGLALVALGQECCSGVKTPLRFSGGGGSVETPAILFAVAGLMVDHTSEHNARAYSSEINKALKS